MTQYAQADFVVIGAGLAGSEASLTLSRLGARVLLFEQKPKQFSAVHKNPNAAELVCSNSFKSDDRLAAHGLLKNELRDLGSPLLEFAENARVAGGKALSVDREKFSAGVEEALRSEKNIDYRHEPCERIDFSVPTLLATGPLSSEALVKNLLQKLGDEGLYFYDATSPVVRLDSLDLSKFFWGSRNEDSKDYLNLPLTREEYLDFHKNVLAAEKVASHDGEELKFFEGCLPLEVIAERGVQTLACSAMKPVGFEKHFEGRAYAVIQFRKERASADLLSMVAFQTRMKWPEQERVFRQLPGMQNAEFARLGAMHRNTFINAPRHLSLNLSLKEDPRIFMAGQITGSEGYTEALATGHYAALSMLGAPKLPEATALRSLVRFLIESDPRYFQPMNFNFGLLPPADDAERASKTSKSGKMKKDARKLFQVERATEELQAWLARNPKFRLGSNAFSTSANWRSDSAHTLTEREASISVV